MQPCYVDYVKKLNILDEDLNIDFSDLSFAYDYNEVQELFFDEKKNNYVFLVGETGLRKKDMLGRICQDLYSRGIEKDDILYLDYDLPFLHQKDIIPLLKDFYNARVHSSSLFMIINEIQELGNWFDFVKKTRANFPKLKFICSSSTPPYIYETIYEKHCDYCKIIVLSQKNNSNIKYLSDKFGVYNEFKYNQKDGFIEIKGLTLEGKKYAVHEVPSEINGTPVKVIASGAFHDRKEMLSISLPNSIEMIGDYAFSKCTSLRSIKLPKSLKYIGDHSFFGATALENIIGGDNVSHIGNSAFYGTQWIKRQHSFAVIGKTLYKYVGKNSKINIPQGIRSVSSYAFANTNITSIRSINAKLIWGEGIFYRCNRLQSVELSIKNITAFMFYGCSKLTNHFNVSNIGKYGLYGCRSVKALNSETLEECALAYSDKITSLKVTKKIDIGACFGLKRLSSFDFNKIKTVGKFAFAETSLKKVNFSGSEIGDYAFSLAKNIQEVIISPDAKIGKNILYACNSIRKMNISGKYKIRWYFGSTIPSVKELTVNGDITDDFNRNNHSLTKLTLIDTNKFGRWSFYNNSQLSQISLVNVKTIGDWAFAYCDRISNISIPSSVNYIGMNAFRYCHNLKRILIKSLHVVPFGANAFYSIHPQKTFFVHKSILNKYRLSALYANFSIDSAELPPISKQ